MAASLPPLPLSMTFCRLLGVAILLGASATASPFIGGRDGSLSNTSPVSVPARLQVNTEGDLKGLIQRDLARAKAFKAGHASPSIEGSNFAQAPDLDVSLTTTGTVFIAEVHIGAAPGTKYDLLVDTGSSNTVISTRTPYKPSSSSRNTTRKVNIKYGSGKIDGFEFTDDLVLGGAKITAQSIGVAVTSEGFDEFDGLLGLGPDDLTRNTVDGVDIVPTVTDNLVKQRHISSAIVGFSVPPFRNPPAEAGSLEFGGPAKDKFTGKLNYFPVTKKSPASKYWGIDQSISYGNKTQILKNAAGIVDTGTTLVLLATDAFQAYVKATGSKKDNATGLLKLANKNSLQSLFFNIGGTVYEFTANAQIWPRTLNKAIGGEAGATYLIVGDLEMPSGQGMDFISGLGFLQRFYSVYDTPNHRVGLATTPFTLATSD